MTTTIDVGQTSSGILRIPPGAEFTKIFVQNITPGNLFVNVSLDGANFYTLQVFVPTATTGAIGTVQFNAGTANFCISVPESFFKGVTFVRFVSNVTQLTSPARIDLI